MPGPEDFFRIVTGEALWLYLLSLSRADPNTKKLHLPSAAIQFGDPRYDITLVQSFTMAARNTVNYARVTGFRREAIAQISEVVARETAK